MVDGEPHSRCHGTSHDVQGASDGYVVSIRPVPMVGATFPLQQVSAAPLRPSSTFSVGPHLARGCGQHRHIRPSEVQHSGVTHCDNARRWAKPGGIACMQAHLQEGEQSSDNRAREDAATLHMLPMGHTRGRSDTVVIAHMKNKSTEGVQCGTCANAPYVLC